MEVTLTDAGTVWSETGPTTIYVVSVKTASGSATVRQNDTGYIELVTTEGETTKKRYYTVDTTEAAVTYNTTAKEIGSFYSENNPTDGKAYLYNASFSPT